MDTKNVRVRFAPSPTGLLHIGGARTALFNWLYAKKHNGQFFLRIEDTDKKRYSTAALDSIINGLQWLGLDYEDNLYIQSAHVAEHIEIAKTMLDSGHAYLSKEEGVIRMKVPQSTVISFTDAVYGVIEVQSSQIEDTVLLRSDGTPTFILSMAVDDHKMGITDVIRGSDHINNTLKQAIIYQALGWSLPRFAHIPLINNEKGEKLSKRDGAISVLEYREMGFLPVAMKNYLLRLGWGHQNHEIIDDELAIQLFSLEGIRASPSCFDMSKLKHLNHHYINSMDGQKLFDNLLPFLKSKMTNCASFNKAIEIFKSRSSTLKELAQLLDFYFQPIAKNNLSEEHLSIINSISLDRVIASLEKIEIWDKNSIELSLKSLAQEMQIATKALYIAMRVALMGVADSPSISAIMATIDQNILINRLKTLL